MAEVPPVIESTPHSGIRPAKSTVIRLAKLSFPTVCFLLIAIWLLAPTLRQLHSTIPTGPTLVATVPLFNAWTIWWNADRALHGFANYWDAPIFHPTSGAFAFSEPQPATLLVAPVYWITGSPIAAYKAWMLLSLTLNGVFAFRLLRGTGSGRLLAMIGGVIMVTLPIVHQQLEVLQMIPVWGILWTWDAVRRMGRKPTRWRGLEAGVACGVTFMLSVHHGLFMALLLPVCAILILRRRRDRILWTSMAIVVVSAGMLVGSLVWPIHRIAAQYEFERSPESVKGLSMRATDYGKVATHGLINPHLVEGRRGWEFSPGWIKMLLATAGIALSFCRRRHRDWRLFLTITALLAGCLSLGPNLRIGTWQPWLTLTEYVPGVGQVRNVFRFAYFVQIAVALLAVAGLQDLLLILKARSTWRLRRKAATVIAVACGTLAVAEIPPAPFLLAGAPDLSAHKGWTTFIRENTQPQKGIACFPFASGRKVADFAISTRWMLLGTEHGVPLTNGYSGFFPQSYFNTCDVINDEFPSEKAFEQLAAADVEFLVVYKSHTSHEQMSSVETSRFLAELVFEDSIGIDVYRFGQRTQTASE